jgi:hypothetical protein
VRCGKESMLEGRIASIAAYLTQLTAQEEAREARRQELAAQVGRYCATDQGSL